MSAGHRSDPAPTPSTGIRRRRAALVAGSLAAALVFAALATGNAPASTQDSSAGSKASQSSKVSKVSKARAEAAAKRPGLEVAFEDNFDGAAGAGVDESKWSYETGDNVSNHERQWYTAGDNAALDGQGNLVITARKENPGNYQCWYGSCEYTSSRINTSGKISAQYGHVESRIKVPRGQGIWPAFWMLGDDFGDVGWPASGEIDVMENVGKEPSTVHGTLHGPGYSGAEGIGAAYSLAEGEFADDFHTFAVDWAPDEIKWSVDGEVYQTRTPADLNGDPWAFNKPFFLILNLAVGGDWPGDPDGTTTFPQDMVVDYVRVETSAAE